jgi:hypothetical protein
MSLWQGVASLWDTPKNENSLLMANGYPLFLEENDQWL